MGDHVCSGCAQGKMIVASFARESKTKTRHVLKLVHMNLIGPMRTASIGGSQYVLTFVDDYSKYVSV